MAKATAPLISFEARGKVASQQIYQRSKSRNIAKSYAAPKNPKSTAQVADRLKMANAVESWRRYQQDPDVRQYWTNAANARKGNRTGYNDAVSALKEALVTDTVPAMAYGPPVKLGNVLKIPMANMLTGATGAEAKAYTVRLGETKDAMLVVSAAGATLGYMYAPITPGPAYVTGHMAWWDASQVWDIDGANRVVQMLDASGQGRTMLPDTIATSPTLVTSSMNGRKALRFNGINQRMKSDAFIFDQNELDLFYVLERGDSGQQQCLLIQRKIAPAFWCFWLDVWDQVGAFTYGRVYETAGIWKQYGGTLNPGPAPHVHRVRTRLADCKQYLDGIERTSLAPFCGYRSNPGITKLCLGVSAEDDNQWFLKGDLAEILIFDHALADDDAAQVTAYLQNKYAIGTPTWTDRQWKFLQLMLYGKPRSGIIPIPV